MASNIDHTLHHVGQVIRACHIFSPVPYDWDFRIKRVVFKSSRFRHCCFIAGSLASLAYDAFSFYGSYKAWINEDLPMQTKIGIYSLSFRYFMLSLLHWGIVLNYRCNHDIINALFKYIKEFQGKMC